MKQIQSKIAQSKLALPITTVYALLVWVAAGTLTYNWWGQLALFCLASYLMVLLNNTHSLIRIYSRLVSCSFIILSCCACFLFPSWRGGLVQLAFVAFYLILYLSYQDKRASGITYYAFVFLGIATIICPQLLCLLPVIWLLMATKLMSFSWRTWAASLLGLLTPYWFGVCAMFYFDDFSPAIQLLTTLSDVQPFFAIKLLTPHQQVLFLFVVILAVMGATHFLYSAHNDKIRTRMFFHIFIWMDVVCTFCLLAQPQHYDVLLRLIIINTSPLVGHFFALTSSRTSGILFLICVGLSLFITIANLWTTLSLY